LNFKVRSKFLADERAGEAPLAQIIQTGLFIRGSDHQGKINTHIIIM
jgi:hypothetical protein